MARMKYKGDGPAVMLCDYTSIFPAQLATYWRSKGIEAVLVTDRSDAPPALPDGTRIVRSCEYETRLTRTVARRVMSPILYRLENTVPRFKRRFTRITGVSTDTQLWMPNFVTFLTGAWPTARAALAQRPRFVFGHEATSYGPATALCRGVPRIIFPWGGDVFAYAEASPYHFAMVKLSLRAADLIVPSSTTAARHISERFGVAAEKVRAVSWGVDRRTFKRADAERREAVCARWGIDPGSTVFLNARRFRPIWGAFTALEAFMRLAAENPSTHFVLFGGLYTEEFTGQARAKLEEAGMLSRFTLLEGDAPLELCAELMSISDVFVSLMGRGDMRSVSVLQATAAGGVPVISDVPEYREMERQGFAARFVEPDSVEDVLAALRFCISNPEEARAMATRNDVYIAEHEDYQRQMDKMLGLIDAVCDDYAAR
jgi:glycosyltransferase involved in cell wall biosynthesis